MKNRLFLMMLASAMALSSATAETHQSASEAKTRMDGMAEIFAKQGLNAFGILNGVSRGGSGSEINSKGSGTDNIENAAVLKSSDPHAELFCVQDNKWAVKQSRPLDVNQDAVATWTDANGKQVVPSMIAALRQSPNGIATVEYSTSVDGVKDPHTGQNIQEKRIALIYSSKALLKKSNTTGKKFFCGTTFSAS